MEKEVLVSILSKQQFMAEKPEVTNFVTQGILRKCDDAFEISYAESELTGLVGTTTTFRVEKDHITLQRSGAVQSKMNFALGQVDRSLYDMGFGALMISVRTERLQSEFHEDGGKMSVAYAITIEEEAAGHIEYEIEVRLK